MSVVIEVVRPSSNPLDVIRGAHLTEGEARYAAAARAANTLRGYASDWRLWCSWCEANGRCPMPADEIAISRWLTEAADSGTRVGTMSRRLSSLRFAHRTHGLADPTQTALVLTVWEGIRRVRSAPPAQAAALMPNELWDAVDALPRTRVVHQRRGPEADLTSLRDRCLLLVGFAGALRRSELAGVRVEDLSDHANGMVLSIPRSKTNQSGAEPELVILPRGRLHCPVAAIRVWCEAAGITEGPLLRPVSTGNQAGAVGLGVAGINRAVKTAVSRIGLEPERYSAHSLRAGFVTWAHLRGASDRAISHQTRHKSLATLGLYLRVSEVWDDNAATTLGL